MNKAVCKGVSGALLLFDLTNRDSFDRLPLWLSLVKDKCDSDIPIILLGNKCDQEELRQVQAKESQDFASRKGLQYIETSTRSAQNVSMTF